MWTADFWKDLVERLFWTFVEAFTGVLIATQIANIDVAAVEAALAAGLAAVLSALKSFAAARIKALNNRPAAQQTAQLGAATYSYG